MEGHNCGRTQGRCDGRGQPEKLAMLEQLNRFRFLNKTLKGMQ